MLFTAVIQLSGFAFGAVLYAFLLALLLRPRPTRSVERALLCTLAGAFAWYLSGAVTSLYEFGKGNPPAGELARYLQYGKWFGLSLISSGALHVATVRAGRLALLSYTLMPVAWLMLHAGMELDYRVLMAGSLAGAMVELLLPVTDIAEQMERGFRPGILSAVFHHPL